LTSVRDDAPPSTQRPGAPPGRPPDDAPAGPGLVTCAITRRVSESPAQRGDGGRRFPTPELVQAAAGLFDRRPGWDGSEGPRPVLTIAPGVVSLSWPDIARRERTAERVGEAARRRVDDLARYRAEHVDDPAVPEPSRVISEW
jgi:hypothetical protein